jgi:hypothetical protein
MKKEIYMFTNNEDFQMKLRDCTIRNVLCEEDMLHIRNSHQRFKTSVYFRPYKYHAKRV